MLAKVEDVQEAFLLHKRRLLSAVDATKSVLSDIRSFNSDNWVVRYPQLREPDTNEPRKLSPRRSLSFIDDPSFEAEVSVAPKQDRRASLPSPETDKTDRLLPSSEFNVLKLDLKLGTHSATSLVHQLEKASIANLLDGRIGASISHIDKLRLRVQDTSSKVLVTGDLNAALHHRLLRGVEYNINDESTFTRGTIAQLEEFVADNEDTQQMIKVYLADTRAPSESLLNNGVVDISLIDAPGLNRDSLKTTAVFARQEEIDVVVFVVSAENHFTLSAKEFLWNASNEKAYLFIVVNKFDQIKNKEKCRRLVLDQIRQLSPRTHDDAEDLVHFVDSATALQPFTANPSFDDLESALRSFVLVKRSKSKLLPVATYLKNVLSDVEFLSCANTIVAETEIQKALADLEQSRPVLEKMKASREVLEQALETIEDEGVTHVSNKTKSILVDALDRLSQGLLAIPNAPISLPTYPGILNIWDYARDVRRAMLLSLDAAIKLAEDEARVTTTQGVDKVKDMGQVHLPSGVERSRRVFMPEAMFSVNRRGGKGNHHNRRRGGTVVVAGGTQGLGIGFASRQDLLETTLFDLVDFNQHFLIYIAPELAKRHALVDTDEDDEFSTLDDEDTSTSTTTTTTTALSVLGIGASALTMVGSHMVGARGIIEGIVRVGEVLENESSRRWVGPILGVVVLGFGGYVIWELPRTVPRTVGRRVRKQVLKSVREEQKEMKRLVGRRGSQQDVLGNAVGATITTPTPTFVEVQAERIGKETRKVLRLASWDLRERFKGALEERGKEVKGAEEVEGRARKAKEWFESVVKRTREVREEGGLEELLASD
ncbi:hypothetical protein Agabi119p4_7213 [Agaricus bisporus var. burnettii]|uniref:Dynamin-type G domain-containing protein n=1 Tax=Agaricus bisporus var. burnettii TaxID=192524 RepID=A0A8H7C7R4_AGABI|nr:hypothetical protein Agabi119p4_7213 [Agaricus bisporus var. burnettii]